MRYKADEFLLGVDGGGTQCRARLADRAGTILGQGVAGPANVRLGLETSLAAVLGAARQCIAEAGFGEAAWARTTACLALAAPPSRANLPRHRRTRCRFGTR
jgi:glucosamine kinase